MKALGVSQFSAINTVGNSQNLQSIKLAIGNALIFWQWL